MTSVILVRHGETVWNLEQRYQGQLDSPLSKQGIIQTEQVAKALSKRVIDVIYCSDLLRARKTAEKIGEYHNLVPYSDSRLREIKFGVWEGLTRAEVMEKYNDIYKARFEDGLNIRVPGGELPGELLERFAGFLEEKISKHQNQTIVIVSHGAALRVIIASLLHIPLEKSYCLRQNNTGISELKFVNNDSGCSWEAVTINCTSHLI
ncbi:MAG: histidine phosphatase family protein [Bacillota bacterium]|nr:histidine phosphatase family protein [Bacillota bacterium]HHU60979.1 histidine phosphatase family protein [Natronincola sp.]